MDLLGWLLGKRKRTRALSHEEIVKRAVEELGRRHAYRVKKGQVRKHHVDDVQEAWQVKAREDDLHALTGAPHPQGRLY